MWQHFSHKDKAGSNVQGGDSRTPFCFINYSLTFDLYLWLTWRQATPIPTAPITNRWSAKNCSSFVMQPPCRVKDTFLKKIIQCIVLQRPPCSVSPHLAFPFPRGVQCTNLHLVDIGGMVSVATVEGDGFTAAVRHHSTLSETWWNVHTHHPVMGVVTAAALELEGRKEESKWVWFHTEHLESPKSFFLYVLSHFNSMAN